MSTPRDIFKFLLMTIAAILALVVLVFLYEIFFGQNMCL